MTTAEYVQTLVARWGLRGMAGSLGVHPSSVADWRDGRSLPEPDWAPALATLGGKHEFWVRALIEGDRHDRATRRRRQRRTSHLLAHDRQDGAARDAA